MSQKSKPSLRTFQGHFGPVSLAFSPDGRPIVSAGAGRTIKFFDATASMKNSSLLPHTGRVSRMACSINSRAGISVSFDRTLKLWGATTGTELRTFNGHSNVVSDVSFNLGGQRIVRSNGQDDCSGTSP